MRVLTCLLLALAANLSAPSGAIAADRLDGAADATLSWRLGFGGTQAVRTGYALALGYRTAGPDALAGQLLELDVDDARAFARVAGLPLFERSYTTAQNEAPTLAEAQPTPWYTRKWVMWTAGGVAATLALTGGDGSVEINNNSTTTTNRGGDGMGCTGVSATDEVNESACASEVVGTQCVEDEVCVFCGNNGVTDGCSEWVGRPEVAAGVVRDVERQLWLDADTGHMGDLVAR
jgi:hypothetical protein